MSLNVGKGRFGGSTGSVRSTTRGPALGGALRGLLDAPPAPATDRILARSFWTDTPADLGGASVLAFAPVRDRSGSTDA